MNRRIEVTLALITVLLACITLLFGDNLFQQLSGHSFFSNGSPTVPILTPVFTSAPIDVPHEPSSSTLPISLDGIWQGEWRDPDGFLFTCEITFEVSQSNDIDGNIIWTLKNSPRASDQSKIGLTATEYISGTFDPQTRVVAFRGYRKDDSYTIISLDDYRLVLSADGNTLSGETANHGDWQGKLTTVRKP